MFMLIPWALNVSFLFFLVCVFNVLVIQGGYFTGIDVE